MTSGSERPSKKPRLMAHEKREVKKAAVEELQRNPPPPLSDIFKRLADSDAQNDKTAVARAADDLTEHLFGKTNVEAYGRRNLEEQVRTMLKRLMLPLHPAKPDIEKRLRLPLDVMGAWDVVGKAGVALTRLNRAKKFPDGKYAFQILHPFVDEVLYLFTDISEIDIYDIVCDEDDVDDLALTQRQLLELEDDIRDEKQALARRFVEEISEPYAIAVKKLREEHKKSESMSRQMKAREHDLSVSCWSFADRGYGERDSDGLGFELFRGARDVLLEWGLEFGSGRDDSE